MDSKIKTYKIYRLTNLETNRVYIGVTSQKPEYRWANGEGYRGNKELYNEIMFFGWRNFKKDILATTEYKEVASLIEAHYISIYKDLGLSYNLQSGGYSGFTKADSTKRKMSESHKGLFSGSNSPMYGKYGKDNPKYGKGLKIIQLDKTTGKVIKIWDCIREAARELKIDQSHITKAAKGKLRASGGYIWKYLN